MPEHLKVNSVLYSFQAFQERLSLSLSVKLQSSISRRSGKYRSCRICTSGQERGKVHAKNIMSVLHICAYNLYMYEGTLSVMIVSVII